MASSKAESWTERVRLTKDRIVLGGGENERAKNDWMIERTMKREEHILFADWNDTRVGRFSGRRAVGHIGCWLQSHASYSIYLRLVANTPCEKKARTCLVVVQMVQN